MNSSKKILLLGSGFVAEAVAVYFHKYSSYNLTIGTIDIKSGSKIANINPERFSVTKINAAKDQILLRTLASQHDIVMSLVPPPLHKFVARACLDTKTNMVTSSYISNGFLLF